MCIIKNCLRQGVVVAETIEDNFIHFKNKLYFECAFIGSRTSTICEIISELSIAKTFRIIYIRA